MWSFLNVKRSMCKAAQGKPQLPVTARGKRQAWSFPGRSHQLGDPSHSLGIDLFILERTEEAVLGDPPACDNPQTTEETPENSRGNCLNPSLAASLAIMPSLILAVTKLPQTAYNGTVMENGAGLGHWEGRDQWCCLPSHSSITFPELTAAQLCQYTSIPTCSPSPPPVPDPQSPLQFQGVGEKGYSLLTPQHC